MKRTVIARISATLLLVVALLLWFSFNNQKAPSVTLSKPFEKQAKHLVRPQDSKDLKSLSPIELKELEKLLQPKHSASADFYVMETIVKPGETVVTAGYQSGNGEYIFSTLTPTPIMVKGKPAVEVHVSRYYLRDGALKQFGDAHLVVNPGKRHGYSSDGGVSGGMEIRMEVYARPIPNGKIQLQTKEFDPIFVNGHALNDPAPDME